MAAIGIKATVSLGWTTPATDRVFESDILDFSDETSLQREAGGANKAGP